MTVPTRFNSVRLLHLPDEALKQLAKQRMSHLLWGAPSAAKIARQCSCAPAPFHRKIVRVRVWHDNSEVQYAAECPQCWPVRLDVRAAIDLASRNLQIVAEFGDHQQIQVVDLTMGVDELHVVSIEQNTRNCCTVFKFEQNHVFLLTVLIKRHFAIVGNFPNGPPPRALVDHWFPKCVKRTKKTRMKQWKH